MMTTTASVSDDYNGVRLSTDASLHTAEMKLKLDISTGDPILPAPEEISIPALLDTDQPITMRGFPITMVLAEKAVTAVETGAANTRWRDFGDIHLLARQHSIEGRQLWDSIEAVATHRGVELRPLRDVLDGYSPASQSRWAAWRRKQNLDALLPEDFAVVLDTVFRLVDPVFADRRRVGRWQPGSQAWC